MDFSFYYDVYGPYRLTPEQVRDRTYYARERTLAMVVRWLRHAWEAIFEEAEYVVRYFCWIVRRDWQGVQRMLAGGVREASYWEPPPPSLFQTAMRSLPRHFIRLRTSASLLVSPALKWLRRLCPSKSPRFY